MNNTFNTESFNFELNKILFDTDDEENNDNDNICLITQNKLESDFVKLECNHKFNYSPLYYEIYNQMMVIP